jgi:hypothetical protein
MAQYTAVAEVSQSIIGLLREALSPTLIKKYEQINLCSPSQREDVKIGLFLYDIQENTEFVTRTMIQSSEDKLQFPPQSLTLYYLLTVYSGADRQSKAIDEQRILGKVMQVLNDHPRFEGEDLKGSLAAFDEAFEVLRVPMTLEDKMKLWQFPNVPYQLSMVYKVQPVFIESTRTKTVKRVTDVQMDIVEKNRRRR